jgi:enoyl-CoA hydratase
MFYVTRRGRVAVVTLAHGKANALDIELCRAVASCFAALKDADAIVLTSQGRIFSAGVDLVRAVAGGADYLHEFLPVLNQAFEAVFFHPRPVVAALNGHAVAGGCVLACAADRRLMLRDGGRIGVTELLVGVPFPPVAFEIMGTWWSARWRRRSDWPICRHPPLPSPSSSCARWHGNGCSATP